MFDIAWSEMVLIGAVALVVIGPKDLPKALRTVGQAVGKMRRMASEFQGQFNDAMREAELDELKKQVENVGDQVKSATEFDPIGQIRDFDTPASPASATAEEATAKLAALPAPEMPPPVEIAPAPVAEPDPEPKPKPRRRKPVAPAAEAVEVAPAADASPATSEETAPPKPPRRRKAKLVEPGEGSPA